VIVAAVVAISSGFRALASLSTLVLEAGALAIISIALSLIAGASEVPGCLNGF